jgi:hypothetical protein
LGGLGGLDCSVAHARIKEMRHVHDGIACQDSEGTTRPRLNPAARSAVAVLRDSRRLTLDAASGGNLDEPMPRRRHASPTLDPDLRAGSGEIAIRHALLAPGAGAPRRQR